MSDQLIDDLLNGDDDFDSDYDLTYENEEALLNDSDSSASEIPDSHKDDRQEDNYELTTAIPNTSNQKSLDEDVLDLDFEPEEEFRDDLSEKDYAEESPDKGRTRTEKFSSERAPQQSEATTKKPQQENKTTAPQKPPPPRRPSSNANNRRNRGRSFPNQPPRNQRRNVHINPTYKGIVRINENKGRLAWDQAAPQQNNFVQPWSPESDQISTLISGIVTQFSQQPPIQVPLVFEPPPASRHFQEMRFEPPPPQIHTSYQEQVSHPPNFPPPTNIPPPNLYRDASYQYQEGPDTYNQFGDNSNYCYGETYAAPNYNNCYNNSSAQRGNNQNNFMRQNSFNREPSSFNRPPNQKAQTHQPNNYTGRGNFNQNFRGPFNSGPNAPRTPKLMERKPFQKQNLQSECTKWRENVEAAELPDKKRRFEGSGEQAPATVTVTSEDDETRLYRLKIEEQKCERERILRMKEERRKQQLHQQKPQPEAPMVEVPLPKSVPQNIKPIIKGCFQKIANLNKTPPKKFIQNAQRPNLQTINRLESQNSSSLTFKLSNNFVSTNKSLPQTEPIQSGFLSNRVVMVKNKIKPTLPNSNLSNKNEETVNVSASSFFNNRKVLRKDLSLDNVCSVTISNLSANTKKDKLMSMSQDIGEVQKLHMDAQAGRATILFKTVASAHAFFKKFQRHMVDLSMIDVKLGY